MYTGVIAMTETTRISLVERVRNPADGASWREFHEIYRPLIFGYLRGLGLAEFDANDLTQEVFIRLLAALPKFKLDRAVRRFRTYLWKFTHNTLIDWARRRKVRDRVQEEWIRQFREMNQSQSRELEVIFLKRHRERILEVVLPQVWQPSH